MSLEQLPPVDFVLLDDFKTAVRATGLENRVHYLAHGDTFDIEVPASRR